MGCFHYCCQPIWQKEGWEQQVIRKLNGILVTVWQAKENEKLDTPFTLWVIFTILFDKKKGLATASYPRTQTSHVVTLLVFQLLFDRLKKMKNWAPLLHYGLFSLSYLTKKRVGNSKLSANSNVPCCNFTGIPITVWQLNVWQIQRKEYFLPTWMFFCDSFEQAGALTKT